MSDAVDGRSAARCRNTTVRGKTSLFYRSDPACAAARRTSVPPWRLAVAFQLSGPGGRLPTVRQ
eukprot:2969738-Prymnesium_polylepis.1